MRKMTLVLMSLALLSAWGIQEGIAAEAKASNVLSRIKRNGFVSCGVTGQLQGFMQKGSDGEWRGFDIDFCRAVAAAIFNDSTKIKIREIETGAREAALEKRLIDILLARISASLSREMKDGMNVAAITYYDGQGILVSKKLEISSASELADKTICVQKATVKAENVTEFFKNRKIFIKTIGFSSGKETFEGYGRGECDAVSADMATLYSWRVMSPHPEEYTFLPDIISKEPIGPVVLSKDREWGRLLYWVHMAMLDAEELNINQRNVDDEKNSPDAAVQRLLGVEGHIGQDLGLTSTWAHSVIKHVGNYAEVFERNLGADTPLKIKRGQNSLWSEGGLQYGLPLR
ncbi:transporter substrate-binding domain-containing protein [Microvirga sp. W0021]|uniref:Transporter substrate-binding domain-containing protein n=1 Tax=Hohaiivirga grylli TaxID=3133970 RepID=A0ABV0BIC0_9HYPH